MARLVTILALGAIWGGCAGAPATNRMDCEGSCRSNYAVCSDPMRPTNPACGDVLRSCLNKCSAQAEPTSSC
jgi:hypothetical protein